MHLTASCCCQVGASCWLPARAMTLSAQRWCCRSGWWAGPRLAHLLWFRRSLLCIQVQLRDAGHCRCHLLVARVCSEGLGVLRRVSLSARTAAACPDLHVGTCRHRDAADSLSWAPPVLWLPYVVGLACSGMQAHQITACRHCKCGARQTVLLAPDRRALQQLSMLHPMATRNFGRRASCTSAG